MRIGLFGDVVIEALELMSFESTYTADYSEHKPLNAKPWLQATGNALDEHKLSLTLHVETADVQTRIDALQTMKTKQQAAPLVTGSNYHGWFVIVDLAIVKKWLTDDGMLLLADVSMTLREYVGDRTTKASKPAVDNGVAPVGMQLQSPSTQIAPKADTNPAIRKSLQAAVAANMQLAAQLGTQSDAIAAVEKMTDDTAKATAVTKIQESFKEGLKMAKKGVDTLKDLANTYNTITASVNDAVASVAKVKAAADAFKPPMDLSQLADKITFAQGNISDATGLTQSAGKPLAAISARLAVRSGL